METHAQIAVPSRSATSEDAAEKGWSIARQPKGARRPAPGSLTVVSDLAASEPVTEAEIALVLAVLRDTIDTMLSPQAPPCP